MDPERWPDSIAEFVAGISCPHCGASRERLIVTAHYQAPVWRVVCNCPSCNTMHDWHTIDVGGALKPKPEQVPLPAWVQDLAKELR